jgi:hypothetical protein
MILSIDAEKAIENFNTITEGMLLIIIKST